MKKYALLFLLTLYINLALCYPNHFANATANWRYLLQQETPITQALHTVAHFTQQK